MTREELGTLLRALVDAGRITAADAAIIVRQFDNGTLNFDRLPPPPSLLPGRLTPQEQMTAIRDVAVRVPKGTATALLTQAAQPQQVTTATPPEVKKFLRDRLRNSFRADYERRVANYTRGLANSGDVATWYEKMQAEQRAYIARQYTAGLGRPMAPSEVDLASRIAMQQQAYLYRFAGEIGARNLAANPLSEAYLQARAAMYQGSGWEMWHRGDEQAQTLGKDGYIVHYQAHDDNRTCGPCIEAERNGPYIAGREHPLPGAICRGHGLCRCTLRIEFDMGKWQELTGQRRAA